MRNRETQPPRRGAAAGRWVQRGLAALGLLAICTAALGAYAYPAIAAAACPACFGLERIAPSLVLEAGMPGQMRDRLQADVAAAKDIVRSFYGTFERQPTLVACSTEACDRRLGGRGARAITLSMPFAAVVRAAPRGLNTTILAHEFSHVELHRRAGLWNQITGTLPAWFDEGLAVIVSGDERYLRPGATAEHRCVRVPDAPLPASPFEWAPQSAQDPLLYADAACKVLRWMETQGGKADLLRAIAAKRWPSR